jgi:hypothetical protein
MPKSTLALAVGLSAILVTSPAAAENAKIFARSGATVAVIAAEREACKGPVNTVQGSGPRAEPVAGQYGLDQVAGTLIVNLVMGSISTARARDRAMVVCMRKKGFAHLGLTDAEHKAYSGLAADSARVAWLDEFLKSGIEERVTVALTPLHPLLPPAEDRPFLMHGLRLLPDSFKFSEGGVPDEVNVVFRSKATTRATARLAAPADFGRIVGSFGSVSGTAPAGAVFHQVHLGRPLPLEAEEDRTLWCGPAETSKGQRLVCVRSGFAGQRVENAVGQPWQAQPDPAAQGANQLVRSPLILEPQPAEAGDTLDVALGAMLYDRSTVLVLAFAKKEGKFVEFWRRNLKIDASGRAVLPFWDRSLVFRRAGRDGLTFATEPRSDGRGWYDEEPSVGSATAS